MDLTVALGCIKTMKEEGHHDAEEYKIGILTRNLFTDVSEISGFPSERKGDVVLYKQEFSWEERERARLEGRKPKPDNTVTIEKPMTSKEIAEQRARGSKLSTYSTCICVPKAYIEEVKI